MKSFRLHKTDWASRRQTAHLIVLIASGLILAYLTQLATSPYSLAQRPPLRIKFAKAVVPRPTPGGQGIHFRRLLDDPPVYEASVRVGDLVWGVVVEGLHQ
jgi:hypothetical protein